MQFDQVLDHQRSPVAYLWILLKGMAMGAADVVPGVSGGTIAFVTGIYTELLSSLRRCNPLNLRILFKQGPLAFWAHINGNFLLCLVCGIALSVLSLAKLITYLLAEYQILVWSFFFGLVLASAWHMLKQIGQLARNQIAALVLGALLALLVSVLRPAQLPAEPMILFCGGAIAICAMILPGISGSFILLLLGLYSVFLNALTSFDWLLVGSFLAGCVGGLLSFSHLLSWLLERYYKTTLSLLTGFLLGSLNVIWPWKHVLEGMTNRHGEFVPLVRENLSPWVFTEITGLNSQWLFALVLMLLGFMLVLGFEKVSSAKVA